MAAPNDVVLPNPNSADYAAAVTLSDSVNFTRGTRGLYVGTGGNVVVVMHADGSAVTFSNVAAGTILPVRAIRVNLTSTTASNIVALW